VKNIIFSFFFKKMLMPALMCFSDSRLIILEEWIALSKIYFFHMVLIWQRTLCYSEYRNLPVTFFHFLHQFWKKKLLGKRIKQAGNLILFTKILRWNPIENWASLAFTVVDKNQYQNNFRYFTVKFYMFLKLKINYHQLPEIKPKTISHGNKRK